MREKREKRAVYGEGGLSFLELVPDPIVMLYCNKIC
jgi:hypothetical protein